MALQIRGAAPATRQPPKPANIPPDRLVRPVRAMIEDIARVHRQAGEFSWHAAGAHLRYRQLLPDAKGIPMLASIDIILDPVLDPDMRLVTHVVRLTSLEPGRAAEEIVAAGQMAILGIAPERGAR